MTEQEIKAVAEKAAMEATAADRSRVAELNGLRKGYPGQGDIIDEATFSGKTAADISATLNSVRNQESDKRISDLEAQLSAKGTNDSASKEGVKGTPTDSSQEKGKEVEGKEEALKLFAMAGMKEKQA